MTTDKPKAGGRKPIPDSEKRKRLVLYVTDREKEQIAAYLSKIRR